MLSYDSTVRYINGKRSGIYFYNLNNGWMSVITIPLDSILQDGWDNTIVLLFILSIVCLLAIMLLTLQSYREK